MTRFALIAPALCALWHATFSTAAPLDNSIITRDDTDDPNDWFTTADAESWNSTNRCDYGLRFDKLEDIPVGVPESAATNEIKTALSMFGASSSFFDDFFNAKMDARCSSFHALRTLVTLLDKTTDDFAAADKDYDENFDYYKQYMKDILPDVLKGWMFEMSQQVGQDIAKTGPAQKYFDCAYVSKPDVRANCVDRKSLKSSGYNDKIRFYIRDRNGFFDYAAQHGIPAEWITWGDFDLRLAMPNAKAGRTDYIVSHWEGFPVRNDSMEVPNPKIVVTEGLKRAEALRADMIATSMDMMLGSWGAGAMGDPAQVYSLPVFMIMRGIDGMNQAKEIVKKAKEAKEKEEQEKKKNLILTILTVIFFFIPVAGPEAAAAAGLVSLARFLLIFGEAGSAALAIYDTVQDPKGAAINVLGALFGLGNAVKVARTERALGDLAVVRGGLKAGAAESFGKIFSENNNKLQRAVAFCRKA